MLMTGHFDMSFLDVEYTYEQAKADIFSRHDGDKFVVDFRDEKYRVEMQDNKLGKIDFSFVQGDREETKPDYYVEHDYAPAYKYIQQYDAYSTKGIIKIPPPFEPVCKPVSKGNTDLYEFIYMLCVSFGCSYDSHYYTKFLASRNRVVPRGERRIKFVNGTEIEPGYLGLVFNPFAAYSSSLIREITKHNDMVRGSYDYAEKRHFFRWKVHHRHWVVNSDVWLQKFPISSTQLSCFSLISADNCFGSFFVNTKPVKPLYTVPPVVALGVPGCYDVGLCHGEEMRVPGVTAPIDVCQEKFLEVEYIGTTNLEQHDEGTIIPIRSYDEQLKKFVILEHRVEDKLSLIKDRGRRFKESRGTMYAKYQAAEGVIYLSSVAVERDRLTIGDEGLMYRVTCSGVYRDELQGSLKYAPSMSFGQVIVTSSSSLQWVMKVLMELTSQEKFEWFLRTYWERVEHVPLEQMMEPTPEVETPRIDYSGVDVAKLTLSQYMALSVEVDKKIGPEPQPIEVDENYEMSVLVEEVKSDSDPEDEVVEEVNMSEERKKVKQILGRRYNKMKGKSKIKFKRRK